MSGRWGVRLATDADADALLRLYECDASGGSISVLTTRRPSPLASLRAEGDRVVYPVVTDGEGGPIVGGGACVVRRSTVDGTPRVVGYLTGLKLLPEHRRARAPFAEVYAYVRDRTPEVECYYTTIMGDNVAAQRLLGRRRPGMPEYRPAGSYTTWCFRASMRSTRRGYELGRTSASEIKTLGHDLEPSMPLTQEAWVWRDRAGDVVATAGVWDQRALRQYLVAGYAGSYRWASRLPVHWLGYPRLPRVGAVAAQASVTQLWVRDWDRGLAFSFLDALARTHRRLDYLAWGAHDSHPLAGVLAGRSTAVTLRSLLYTVHFDDHCAGLSGAPVALDVALL